MGSTELAIMRLLKTIETCRQTLDETVKSLRVIDSELFIRSSSKIWAEHGAVDRIAAYATVLVVHPTRKDDGRLQLSLHNRLSLLTSIEVVEEGFQVAGNIYATFDWTMGATPKGSHNLHEHRSGILTCDEAVVEAEAQTAIMASLDTYHTALGLVVAPADSPPT